MKVLIVEDNADSRNLLVKQLSAYGHEVTAAVDGVDALEKAQKSPPDILVSDILMPRMDGYKLCYEWNQHKRLKDIPFVFYTAIYTSSKDEKFGLSLGANLFIRKPLEPEALAKILSQVFEQAKEGLLPTAKAPPEPSLYLTEYNERLVAKLNEKVAELETSEEELRYLGSILGAIRSINQLIVRERDKSKLLRSACRILHRVREYRFVWIGLIEAGHKRVIPAARAGIKDSYLDKVAVTWDDSPSGQGPTGTAIKTKKPDLIDNIKETQRPGPWEAARKRGYRSLVAIPIIHDEKVYGVLNVYSSQPDGFDDTEVGLLVELSSDIGFALGAIERQEARQQAEEALRESNQRFKDIAENALEWIWEVDTEGKYTYSSPVVLPILGYKPEEVLGKYFYDLAYPDDREELKKAAFAAFARKQPFYQFLNRSVRKDGEVVWISTSGVPILDKAGKLLGYRGADVDITERKQAEEALRESEAFQAGLLSNSPIPISVINADTSVRYVSPALEKLTGFAAEELLWRKPPYPYWPKERRKEIIEHFENAMRQGSRGVVELYQKKNGEKFWVEITSTPVKKDGRFQYLLGSWVDITERKQAEEALRESEARYRAVIEGAHDMIQSVSLDGRIIFVNKAWRDTLGYTEAELSDLNMFDIIHPDFHEHCREMLAEIVKGKPAQNIEVAFLTKDGRQILVEGNAAPRYIGKKVVATQGIFRDVTERKQAEAALRQSEEKLRVVLESIPLGVTVTDLEGKILQVNNATLRVHGFNTREELIGRNAFELIAEEDHALATDNLTKTLETGRSGALEYTLIRKDGTTFPGQLSAALVKDESAKPIGFVAVTEDITERKRAEEALRESEEKYKNLVGATSDIIWETDADGWFTFISPKIKDILGYRVAEVVGKKRTLDLVPKGQFPRWLERFREINAKKAPFFGLEIAHLHKNGRQVIFETSGIPLFDSAGKLKGYVGINKDVTERRHMQEQLVITDRLASVGELAAGIAHELNNPLTGVIGFSQLLLDKEMPEDIKQDVKVVYSEAQRASQVVKNLLTFARKHAAVKEKVNLNDIINKVLELRAYEQNLENIKVNAHFDPKLPEIMVDYFQLQQVFLNIVINAEYFMKEAHHKGELTITTEKVDNKVRASFADDGPGIAKEDLGHLFDPFFTTKEVGKGTGLGLSICHGIVAEHGGRIYVESEPGKGATFIVELPIDTVGKRGDRA